MGLDTCMPSVSDIESFTSSPLSDDIFSCLSETAADHPYSDDEAPGLDVEKLAEDLLGALATIYNNPRLIDYVPELNELLIVKTDKSSYCSGYLLKCDCTCSFCLLSCHKYGLIYCCCEGKHYASKNDQIAQFNYTVPRYSLENWAVPKAVIMDKKDKDFDPFKCSYFNDDLQTNASVSDESISSPDISKVANWNVKSNYNWRNMSDSHFRKCMEKKLEVEPEVLKQTFDLDIHLKNNMFNQDYQHWFAIPDMEKLKNHVEEEKGPHDADFDLTKVSKDLMERSRASGPESLHWKYFVMAYVYEHSHEYKSKAQTRQFEGRAEQVNDTADPESASIIGKDGRYFDLKDLIEWSNKIIVKTHEKHLSCVINVIKALVKFQREDVITTIVDKVSMLINAEDSIYLLNDCASDTDSCSLGSEVESWISTETVDSNDALQKSPLKSKLNPNAKSFVSQTMPAQVLCATRRDHVPCSEISAKVPHTTMPAQVSYSTMSYQGPCKTMPAQVSWAANSDRASISTNPPQVSCTTTTPAQVSYAAKYDRAPVSSSAQVPRTTMSDQVLCATMPAQDPQKTMYVPVPCTTTPDSADLISFDHSKFVISKLLLTEKPEHSEPEPCLMDLDYKDLDKQLFKSTNGKLTRTASEYKPTSGLEASGSSQSQEPTDYSKMTLADLVKKIGLPKVDSRPQTPSSTQRTSSGSPISFDDLINGVSGPNASQQSYDHNRRITTGNCTLKTRKSSVPPRFRPITKDPNKEQAPSNTRMGSSSESVRKTKRAIVGSRRIAVPSRANMAYTRVV